jgi:TRAP transporter TAXI family solute receptor
MKRKWMKMTAYVVLVAFQICIALPALHAASEKEPPKPLQLSIHSFAFGSSAYVICQGLANLINKHSTSLKASAIETKGTITNIQTLAAYPKMRKNTLIYTVLEGQQWAKMGEEFFKKPYTSLKAVANWTRTLDAYVTFDKNIKMFGDLAGKRVAVGEAGTGISRFSIARLQHGWGILDKVKVEYMGFGASKDALINGTIDAGFAGCSGVGDRWVPPPSTVELLSQPRALYWISDTEEAFKRARKKTGWPIFYGAMPAGTLGPKQPEPFLHAIHYTYFAADAEMDDQVMTEICRIFWEYSDEFKTYHKAGEAITKPTMAKIPVTREDFHAAAVKFYQEKGIKIGLGDWHEFEKFR